MARHRYTNEEVEKWKQDNKKVMYANPDDSRIFVRRSYGFGLSPNWANPVSWIIIVVIVAAIIGLRFLLPHWIHR